MSALELESALHAAAHDRAFVDAENRMLWRLVAGTGTVTLLLAATLAVLVMRGSPEPDIVASTADGRIIRATRLDEPMMSDDAFRLGVARAIVETFTLAFHDYEMRLDAARRFYTEEAWQGLLEQFETIGFIDRLTRGYQVVETVLEGSPTIVSRTRHDGVLYLAFATPVLMTFRSGGQAHSERVQVSTMIRRVPLSENIRGWAIAQTLVERGGTGR